MTNNYCFLYYLITNLLADEQLLCRLFWYVFVSLWLGQQCRCDKSLIWKVFQNFDKWNQMREIERVIISVVIRIYTKHYWVVNYKRNLTLPETYTHTCVYVSDLTYSYLIADNMDSFYTNWTADISIIDTILRIKS